MKSGNERGNNLERKKNCLSWETANLLIFPLFYRAIEFSKKYFSKNEFYKKSVIYLSSRARSRTKTMIKKYGVWGLMVFVMIPLPVTGAYTGTIAAYIFRISYKKSLIAISIGVTISSIMVTSFMFII